MTQKTSMTAVILAGGKNSKETALEYLVHLSTALFSETFVIINKNQDYSSLKLTHATFLVDLFDHQGPLAGLYTGLSYAIHQACCVLSCDAPLVDVPVIRKLIRLSQPEYDIICFADSHGGLQPFPGIYPRSSRHLIRLLLDRGERSMNRLLEVAVVKSLPVDKEKILPHMKTSAD